MLARMIRSAGLMLVFLSAVSYWAVETRPPGGSLARPNLLTTDGQLPIFNAVIAGRDIEYCKPGYGPGGLKAVPCEGAERYSGRTDTIMFIRVQPGKMDVISIPRDTLVQDQFGGHKVNSTFQLGGDAALAAAGISGLKEPGAGEVYSKAGAEALKTTLEGLLGVGIDYYMIFNVEFVEKVIDALGGVDVYLPEPMDYDDNAAGLNIHIPAGNQHLDAKTAIGYLRFRHGYGSDYARMDRGKAVIGQLLEKVKSPQVLAALPTLITGLSNDVQTNMDLEFVRTMLPHARALKPRFGTLPTLEQRYSSYLLPDREKLQALLGLALATDATDLENLPTAPATIVNQSGIPNLGLALAAYLKRSGLPEAEVQTFEAADEPTQVLRRAWADTPSVEYYSHFMGVPVFEPYRYPEGAGPIVIQLGKDAGVKYGGLVLEANTMPLQPKP